MDACASIYNELTHKLIGGFRWVKWGFWRKFE